MTLQEQIAAAGVVGCGGAGFPSAAKLGKTVEHLILNGAECEPLLRTDRYLMRHKAVEITAAADALRRFAGAKHCTIALKGQYTGEIAALSGAIKEQGYAIALHPMDSFYPAGDEQVIVESVTGRAVPPGGIPLEVGAVVYNVATAAAIHDAMEGIPFTHKYLTVTGEVGAPCILRVPVGTCFSQCIALAGGAAARDCLVVSGGPMMGSVRSLEEAADRVVTKTTSGILVLRREDYLPQGQRVSALHMRNRAAAACIQCSYCTQFCPRHLLGHPLEPHRIMRKLGTWGDLTEHLDDPVIRQAALCCECGICEVCACPMELQPRQVNAMLKKALAEAGIRYDRRGETASPLEEWPLRRIPTRRAAARAGVSPHYDLAADAFLDWEPDRVAVPLKQHIGAPSVPSVSTGERVEAGQRIAACPPGALGADIHAGISGDVVEVTDKIVIEGRR